MGGLMIRSCQDGRGGSRMINAFSSNLNSKYSLEHKALAILQNYERIYSKG